MENTIQTEQVEETVSHDEVKKELGLLSQDQVDEAIASRLKREREKFAKTLGIDSYNEESIENFLNDIKTKQEQIELQNNEISVLREAKTQQEFVMEAMKSGVKSENLERAIKLAQLEVSDEVSIEQAIANVLEDFPMLKSGTQEKPLKVGSEVKNEVVDKTDVDRYLENRYGNSKYFRK